MKLEKTNSILLCVWSPLAQGRGLKSVLHAQGMRLDESPLAQGRGLKLLRINGSLIVFRRPSRRGVD